MTPVRYLLCLLALVLPGVSWPGSTSYESAKLLLWLLVAAAWAVLLAWAVVRRRPLAVPPRGLLIAGGALLVVMLPGLWLASSPTLVGRAMLMSALWWATAIAAALSLPERNDRARFLAWATAGVAACCGLALLQISGAVPSHGEPYVPLGIGTLGNENYVAELAAIWLLPAVIPVFTGGGARARTRARRAGSAALAAVLLAMLVVSSAAGARVAAIAALVFVAAGEISLRARWRRRAPAVLGALVLVAALSAGAVVTDVQRPARDPAAVHSWTSRVFDDNNGAIRRTDWLVARHLWAASPLTGCGAGNYGINWPTARAALGNEGTIAGLAEHAPVATRAHHEYLQVAAELGWLGVLWLTVVAGAGAARWRRRWLGAADDAARRELLLMTAGLLAAAVTALVSFPAHLPASGLTMALLVGMIGATKATPSARRYLAPPALAIAPLLLAAAVGAGAVRAFDGDLLIARGTRQFVAGNLDAAVAPLREGVALLPWPNEGRLYLGLALAADGQADEAARTLEASRRDRPSFEALLALAELHLDARRFDSAAALLELVDDCRPPQTFRQQADHLRGLIALRQERLTDAAAAFTTLVAADPGDHRSWLALGYVKALRDDRDGAADCYRRALAELEAKIASAGTTTAAARGQTVRWRLHRETARKALASVTD